MLHNTNHLCLLLLPSNEEADKIELKYLLNFPISSYLISYVAHNCSSLLLFFPSLSVLLLMSFLSPCLSRTPVWPTSVRLVFRPLTILQWAPCQLASALNSFAPSACCQNSPHQSGTLALWKPVPIRLSSGTLYPFAFVFYHSSFGLTFSVNLLACRPSVTCLPFYLYLYLSPLPYFYSSTQTLELN